MSTMKLLSSTAAVALLLGTAYGASAASKDTTLDSIQIAQDSGGSAAGASSGSDTGGATGGTQSETGGASDTGPQTQTEPTTSSPEASPDLPLDESGSGTTTGQTETETAPGTTGAVQEQTDMPEGQSEAELAARADQIIGQPVVNSEGDEIGDIEDLVVDPNGQVHAVVGVGGFLGIGERSVAISVKDLEFGAEQALYTGFSSADDLKEMPEYTDTGWRSLKS